MKNFLGSFCIFLVCSGVSIGQNSFSVFFSPVYQNWSISDETDFNELTNLLAINYSVWRNTNFSFNSRYSMAGGDVNSIKGFSDSQLAFGLKLPSYNLKIDAGVGIPTGKTKLTDDEYATSMLLSQSVFGMHTANFGQGLNIFFGATYVFPLSDGVVAGAGISYQVRSEYQPLESADFKYEPSDEITATAGLDIKLDQVSSITGDFTGIFYGSDKADGREIFTAGRRLIFNLQYKRYFRFDTFTLTASYRNAGIDKLEYLPSSAENDKVNPDLLYFGAGYLQYISRVINLGYTLYFSSFEETVLFYSGYKFFGIALSPEFKLSPSFKIPLRLKFITGSASGKPGLKNYELAAGISYSM